MPVVPLIALVMTAVLAVALRVARWRLRHVGSAARVRVGRFVDHTGSDRATGTVYSIQSATMSLPADRLDEAWTARHLEHLARLYWLYIEKTALGLLRVRADTTGRYVCFLTRRLPLLGFHDPEFDVDHRHGEVTWGIAHGLLIARSGRDHGHLRIEISRGPVRDEGTGDGESRAEARIEIEVVGYRPVLSSGFAARVYAMTQSRYHVLLAYGFLHSLATADLDELRLTRLDRLLGLGRHEPRERMPSG